MILSKGEKIHVIHRRLFEKDIGRHFVGMVEEYEHGVARVAGYVYTVDHNSYKFVRRPGVRTRVISLASGELLVNVIPATVDLNKIVYETGKGFLRVTDGSDWHLDISEFTWV
ncbi:MAG: hypothetical protein HY360_15855 [Verrucomicrobia bacterium]|nr:hypothetical protein [Verrucomicrobiota bacterium]